MNSPFVGPKPFARSNALFGRDAEIEELRWRIIADRILVLYSPSGGGKTSLLCAKNGLLRNMRDRFRVLPVLRVWGAQPGTDVYGMNCVTHTILVQLKDAGFGDIEATDTLQSYFARIPAPRNIRRPTRLLMVIDQAEEIFAPAIEFSQQHEFFRQLGELLSRMDSPVWFVLSMREEYFSWLDSFRELVVTRLANTFRLTPLSVEQAVEAIKGPAQKAGVKFPIEAGQDAAEKLTLELSQTRVRDRDGVVQTRAGISVEPVQLQVICADLWTRLSEKGLVTEIRVADIESHRPAQALQDYCDQTLHKAAPAGTRARKLRDWIERKLLTPSGLRAQAAFDNADKDKPTQAELHSLLDAHLIRGLTRPDGEWYELSHDSLTAPVRESIEKWRVKHSLVWQQLARSWQLGGRSSAFLNSLSRERLESIPSTTSGDECSDDEAQFLEAIQAHRQQKRRVRALTAGIVLVAMVAGGGWITSKWEQIKTQRMYLAMRNVAATQAALMTILGSKPNVDLEARAAVAGMALQKAHAAEVGFDFRPVLAEQFNKNRQIERTEIIGTKNTLRAWTNDRYRVTAEPGLDRWQMSITEVETGKEVWSPDIKLLASVHPHGLSTIALMPGDRMASAGGSGEIAIWDISSKSLLERNIAIDPAHALGPQMRARIRSLVSLDTMLVAGNENAVVAAWRATAQAGNPRLLSAVKVQSIVSAIAPFDGVKRLAVADMGEDEQVSLLSLIDGVLTIDKRKLVAQPKEGDFRGAFYSVAVSPDGRTVAAGNRAGKIHFWDSSSGLHKGRLDAHLDNVVQLRFLEDNNLLSAGWDGQLKLWSPPWHGQNPVVTTLLDVPRQLDSVALGRIGKSAFVTTEKGDLFSVSLSAMRHPLGQFFAASGTAASMLLEQDENIQLAMASADAVSIQSLEQSTKRAGAVRRFNLPEVSMLAWAPDKKLLYAAQKTAIKLIRDGATEPVDLRGLQLAQSEEIRSLATNADGSIVVALTKTVGAMSKRDIKIWGVSAADGRAICAIDPPAELKHAGIQLVAFRPKKSELVTVIREVVSIWPVSLNAQGCPELGKDRRLPGEALRGEIRAISFDKKGSQLFLGNFSGVISSAMLDTTIQPGKPLKHDSVINITALAASDVGVVAFGDNNGKLYVLYPDNELAVPLVQDVHRSTINSLSLSADGRWLTSSAAGVVGLWDLSLDSWVTKACELANHRSFSDPDRLKFFKQVEGELNTCSEPATADRPQKS